MDLNLFITVTAGAMLGYAKEGLMVQQPGRLNQALHVVGNIK